MRKFILLFTLPALMSVISKAQTTAPSLSSFTATQQAQIKSYSAWQARQSADSIKITILNLLMPVTKGTADSLSKFASLYKALQAKDDSSFKIAAALKIRIDSSVNALKLINSNISTMDIELLKKTVNEVLSKQQLTDGIIAIIKEWMDRIKLKELNFK